MTDAAPEHERADISAVAVWIACLALYVVLTILAFTAPHILSGPGDNTEPGVLEQGQNLSLLIALLLMIRLAFITTTPMVRAWMIFVALGTFYLLGEEASWGQHYFGWETGGIFAEINDQNETNIHNTQDGWFDQKPRALLLLGMILGTIVHPLVKWARKGRGLFDKPWWLAPTLASLPPVVFSQIGAMPERLDDINDALHFTSARFQDVFSYRSSEMEEIFMYIFFITYTLSLGKRLAADKTAGG
jgi:hypothetical protein